MVFKHNFKDILPDLKRLGVVYERNMRDCGIKGVVLGLQRLETDEK